MNEYISFLCRLLGISIPKVFFKDGNKFFDLKNKPIQKEVFQIKDTSVCTSYPKENVICVNLDACSDKTLLYVYLAHELRHLYQYACVYKKNQKVFYMDQNNVSIWKKELENYKDSQNENYECQEIEKDASLFANFNSIVILKKPTTIKGVEEKEYNMKTMLFMQFFGADPIKKKLIQKEIKRKH